VYGQGGGLAGDLIDQGCWTQALLHTAVTNMGKLQFLNPVPADIEIAQSVTPVPISEIAKKLDISSADFEPHGTTKAKVPPAKRHARSRSSDHKGAA
jgi:hypothetical protein